MTALIVNLEARQKALAERQAAMKQQMLEEGTHLFCGRPYTPSTHGSVILSAIIERSRHEGRAG